MRSFGLNLTSFTNSSKYRKYVDYILKEELGPLYMGIPGLYKVFFREVKGLKEHNWPRSVEQNNILKWFNNLIKLFLGFAEEYGKLYILILEELKSNLNTNIASQINKEQLRFNPTILILDGKRYIKVMRNNQTKRLILNKPIKRARYIAVYYKGDTSKIPLRKKEGELLRKVIGKEVEDNIYKNVRKGLDIIRATNYKLKDLIMPLRPAGVKISIRKGRSSSRNRLSSKKRSSSYTNAPLPPSKHIYLGSPPLGGRRPITLN
ncbi:hypothetical protein V2W45_1474019 [Cenococcum geophilum]